MKRVSEILGPGPERTKQKPSPQHHECPEGNGFLLISDKRHKINILLDYGSNIVLLNQNSARTLNVPYKIGEKLVQITAFYGEVSSTGGKYHTHPIQLEIGANGHTTMVSCEIADPGKYDMIIAFGWWQHEHPITNIETPEKWYLEHTKCVEHVQDEGITDMFEWDETVAFDNEARMIGRIASTRQEEVQLEGLLKPYWQYKELFENEKAEMLAPRRIFDHAKHLKDGATPPWGPIYPIWAYQIEELSKYLHKMLAEAKIVHSKSPVGGPILFVPKPDGRQ